MVVKRESDDNVNQKKRFKAMFPTTCSQARADNFRHFFVAAKNRHAGERFSLGNRRNARDALGENTGAASARARNFPANGTRNFSRKARRGAVRARKPRRGAALARNRTCAATGSRDGTHVGRWRSLRELSERPCVAMERRAGRARIVTQSCSDKNDPPCAW